MFLAGLFDFLFFAGLFDFLFHLLGGTKEITSSLIGLTPTTAKAEKDTKDDGATDRADDNSNDVGPARIAVILLKSQITGIDG